MQRGEWKALLLIQSVTVGKDNQLIEDKITAQYRIWNAFELGKKPLLMTIKKSKEPWTKRDEAKFLSDLENLMAMQPSTRD